MATLPSFNCPSCGAALSPRFKYSKIITCEHCSSGLFLDDKAVQLRGESAVMADYPSLLKLYADFQYKNWRFQPIGHLRFEYAHGFWDEWWVISASGEGKWVSVDEGDYAIEVPVKINNPKIDFSQLSVGTKVPLFGEQLLVTELGQATCIGLEGELPEVINLHDQFQYAHLSGKKQTLFTLELQHNTLSLYKGTWVDAFEIKAL